MNDRFIDRSIDRSIQSINQSKHISSVSYTSVDPVWAFATALLTTVRQRHFTISEVAADWHKLMTRQHIMQLFTAHDNKQFDQTYDCPN